MNHDPMCPYFPEQQGFGGIRSGVPSTQPYIPGVPCQCALIARVREDERGYAKQTSAAVMAYGEGKRDGYAAALRDAVEAVKVVGHDVHCNLPFGNGCSCPLDDAVDAIEALGDPPPLPPTTGRQHKY